MGLTLRDLGTKRLSWRTLKIILRYLPPESAFNRERQGPEPVYSVQDYLLVGILNGIRALTWVTAGNDDNPRPSPLLLPGMVDPEEPLTFGSYSIEEMDERLAQYGPR